MIHFKIFFDEYKWTIEVFIGATEHDIDIIEARLKTMGCSEHCVNKAIDNTLYNKNSGFTYTNLYDRYSVMSLNCGTSMDQFINTYHHEKNHIEMHIVQYYGIDPMSEEASQLSGDLAQRLFVPMMCSFIQ